MSIPLFAIVGGIPTCREASRKRNAVPSMQPAASIRIESRMQVSEVMTRQVEIVSPDASLQKAAAIMEAADVGSLPVCEGRRLLGAITDRDIVIRGVATGASPVDMLVRDCMSDEISYVYEDEDVEAALERMEALQVRRLVVLDREKNLVGIVSLGDIAIEPRATDAEHLGEAITEISEPSFPDK
jgi:CBS domain-containing protein